MEKYVSFVPTNFTLCKATFFFKLRTYSVPTNPRNDYCIFYLLNRKHFHRPTFVNSFINICLIIKLLYYYVNKLTSGILLTVNFSIRILTLLTDYVILLWTF